MQLTHSFGSTTRIGATVGALNSGHIRILDRISDFSLLTLFMTFLVQAKLFILIR
jgi:hypothetical protein